MRFWKYLLGSMIRLSGVFAALVGFVSAAFGLSIVFAIPAVIVGVVLYLVGRWLMLSYGPYRKA